jgi:hypothetical protein
MGKEIRRLLSIFLLACALWTTCLQAQPDRPAQSEEAETYGSKFFDQLRTIFGKFRDMDLQRVFQEAQPIQCSELVGRKGEWRTVAFFNEDRKLGDWCRESLQEVKSDLAVFTFKGGCGDPWTLQVSTEFPISASVDDLNLQRIGLNQIDVTVNDPVKVAVNLNTKAYTFELPYLFLTGHRGSTNIYSLAAPDRNAAYASEVSSRWECKAVFSEDVTYRFLICRTATVPRGRLSRDQKWEPSFGSSAFFILSDGMEAQSSVKLSFGDKTQSSDKPEEAEPASKTTPRPRLKR